MNNIKDQKPSKLGYYKVRLRKGSPLHKIYGTEVITARYIERDKRGGGVHRFFDLPKPSEGVEGWELVAEH